MWPAARLLYIIWGSLGQRDKPLLSRRSLREHVIGRTIVIVDDVWTTGATLNECARVLKEAGATEVRALTVARALEPQ